MSRVITQQDAMNLRQKWLEDQPKPPLQNDDGVMISGFTPVPEATIAFSPPSVPPPPDEYLTRLQKLIPAEVVAAFLAIDGIVRSGKTANPGKVTPETTITNALTIAQSRSSDATQIGNGVMNTAAAISPGAYWIIYGILIVLCAAYIRKTTALPGLKAGWKQIISATMAFIIWTYAIGGPFAYSQVDVTQVLQAR